MKNSFSQIWNPGQVLMDDFVVERTLGEGGMGKVYLLRSKSTGSQFAVKRAKGLEADQRKRFLAELQTWIDLPEHANLVPCRFFRTLGNELLIFAEYVEGGSLQEWIASRKLYAGGQRQALERMLDVAIQFAWGVHCLHELGLVHQDVKPGNVLMGADQKAAVRGVRPMVTDYGLARARAAAGERYVPELGRSVLVSCGGGTPAYWSPEQALGLALMPKTDIWAWGLSVLEMFVGDVSWMSGQVAAEVLVQYLQNRGDDEAIPPMPAGVAVLLRRCFRHDPANRPQNLAEAVETLKEVFRKTTGSTYSRALSAIERVTSPQAGIKERRHQSGAAWTDPKEWLEKALRAAGRDPEEAATIVSRRGATRRGELVAEIAVYDEAKRLYERLVRDGRKELESDLATLCVQKALVHSTAADGTGALREYDQAIAIRERLVNQEGSRELANELAGAYIDKAIAVSDLGDDHGVVALYDQAIAIRERLVNQEGRRELAYDLSTVYMNKALAGWALGNNRGAVVLYDQAIAIMEQLVNQEGRRDLASELARVYMNKAVAVRALGDNRGAMALYDQAIAILERLVNQEGRRELDGDLAWAVGLRGVVLVQLGETQRGRQEARAAMNVLRAEVQRTGRADLKSCLDWIAGQVGEKA